MRGGIPGVLADPPWRREPGAAEELRPTAPAAPAPVRLSWKPGEREELAGAAHKKLPEEAEDRLFERLVDQIDRSRPVQTPELARLSDERLAELAEEVTADSLLSAVLTTIQPPRIDLAHESAAS